MICHACKYEGAEKSFVSIGEMRKKTDNPDINTIFIVMACPKCTTLRLMGDRFRGKVNEGNKV